MSEELKCPCCGGCIFEVRDSVWNLVKSYECNNCVFRCGSDYLDQIAEGMKWVREERKRRVFYRETTFA